MRDFSWYRKEKDGAYSALLEKRQANQMASPKNKDIYRSALAEHPIRKVASHASVRSLLSSMTVTLIEYLQCLLKVDCKMMSK